MKMGSYQDINDLIGTLNRYRMNVVLIARTVISICVRMLILRNEGTGLMQGEPKNVLLMFLLQ